jgi:hypothetical protein
MNRNCQADDSRLTVFTSRKIFTLVLYRGDTASQLTDSAGHLPNTAQYTGPQLSGSTWHLTNSVQDSIAVNRARHLTNSACTGPPALNSVARGTSPALPKTPSYLAARLTSPTLPRTPSISPGVSTGMRGKQLAAIKLKPHSQKIWEILFSIGRKTGAGPAPPLALPLSLSLFLVTADPPAEFTVFSCCCCDLTWSLDRF